MKINQKVKIGVIAGLIAGAIHAIIGIGSTAIVPLIMGAGIRFFVLPMILVTFAGVFGGMIFALLYNKIPSKSHIIKGVVFGVPFTILISEPIVMLYMAVNVAYSGMRIDTILSGFFSSPHVFLLISSTIFKWLINGLIYGVLLGILFDKLERTFKS